MKIFAKGSHQGGKGTVMDHCCAVSGSEMRKKKKIYIYIYISTKGKTFH